MAIDTTIGGASADSYLSVAEADAYAAADLGRNATAWAEAQTDTKERALKRATRDLSRIAGYTGARWSFDQALVFPRSIDLDPVTGLPVLPVPLKNATAEQAMYVIRNANVIDDAASRRARGLSNFTEPDVGGQLADDPDFGAISPRAIELLQPLAERSVIGWISTT